MRFACNVGGWDRAARIGLGLILVVLGLLGVFTGAIAVIGYVIGAIALVTGVVAWCPASALLGINTCRLRESGP